MSPFSLLPTTTSAVAILPVKLISLLLTCGVFLCSQAAQIAGAGVRILLRLLLCFFF